MTTNTICTCTEDCALGFNPNCECTCEECKECKNISNMIGEPKSKIFDLICEFINQNYQLDKVWNRQKLKTRKWKYEYKFSKSKKTLCGFYVTDNCLGFMLIFGKQERAKIEENRNKYSAAFLDLYDKTETYHDGKWVMMELEDDSLLEDIKQLLVIKKKPNKK